MMLVSCGTDLKFHDSSSYELVHVYRPADSTGQIRNVSWCKDGSWIVVVPNRGNAEIVRTKEDVRLLQTILGVAQPTAAVFQRSTKRNVAMSTVNGGVLIYDIKGKSIKKRFVNTGSRITLLDWNLKDSHLATGCTDGEVTLYSNTTNQKSSVITIPDSKSVSALRFHPNLRAILGTASDEGVVAVWDIHYGRDKMCLKPHKAPVTDLVFSAQNNNLLVTVGLDRTFHCYDINAGLIALPVMTDHPLSSVDMAPDGFIVAAASSRGMIYFYDLRKPDKPLKSIAAHSGEIRKISYQPFAMESTVDSIQIAEEKPVDFEVKSSNVSVDSFAHILENINEFSKNDREEAMEEEIIKSKTDSAAGDSFFNGLDNFDLRRITGSFLKEKSELSNLKLSDSVKKWLDTRENLDQQSSASGKLSDIAPKILISNSTPKQQTKISFAKNEESNISPIVGYPTIPAEELNKIINNAVKEVVTEQISDLTDTLRSYFLDLQLVLSKQCVGLDSHIEKLFDYYCNSVNSNQSTQLQQLQQENEFLRHKINELMRKNNS